MLVDRENLRLHLVWILLAVALTGGAIAWYVTVVAATGRFPGGSSFPGFTCGVGGGLIILFEFLLWPRKKVRTWRIGRVKHWMAAHIWLGLACFPLLVLHSGFALGGTLSTALMVLLTLVIVSGVWGLAMQQVIPRAMLAEIPAETIYSQIERVMELSRREAERLVLATCGPAEGEAPGAADAESDETPDYLVVGAQRTAGRTQGVVLQTQVPKAPVAGSEPLRDFFQGQVVPFLRAGAASGSPLRQKNRAEAMFQSLRTQLDVRAHGAVSVLEDLCEQRRQLDRQARLHVWLHNWLLVHLPLSLALVVLMFVHVYVALKYW
ncbi:MAG TPA: hypothetical protein VF590_14730 [Isosphaeraceae bacterium]